MLLLQLLELLVKDPIQFIVAITMLIVPLFLSITFHEWAHGYVAYKFGDLTPKMYGRLTLNPFAHLDPLGTLMLFMVGIGWAKPVPINPLNIPDRTKQMLVALAGPLSNILLAVIFAIILVALDLFYKTGPSNILQITKVTMNIVIKINLILAIFNMLPVPPLDGSSVIARILPERYIEKYYEIQPYGIPLLLIIMFTIGFKFIFLAADFIQLKLIHIIRFLINSHIS